MVRGPATVRVDGTCSVLGMDVSNMQLAVRRAKVLPFEPQPGCRLEIISGESWLADPLRAGTLMWERTASRILSYCRSCRRRAAAVVVVMLAGGTDTGKSTFSIYLANKALRTGIIPVSIIDGDIGQGDLAPPMAPGGAVISSPAVDLRDVDADLVEFVGVTTPAGSERLVARRLQSIVGRMRRGGGEGSSPRAALCIVNTDGYVSDGACNTRGCLQR